MDSYHDFKTIVRTPDGYVGYCKCCRIINVSYKNSLFCFTIQDYRQFYELVRQRKCMRQFYTSHGKECLMTTPISNYYLLFDEKELKNLEGMLDEASPLLNAIERLSNLN